MVSCVSLPFPPDTPDLYREFWQLWQEERFFECHEVLEMLWRETTGQNKLFYHGLIHCAVAIYQHRRDNAYGAARQLCRASVKLERFAPRYLQVEIDCLLCAVRNELATSLSSLDSRQQSGIQRLEEELKVEMRGRIDRNLSQELKG